MPNLNKQTILDVKIGNVIEKDSKDKVILVGSYFEKGSNYVENIEIVINPGDGNEPITTKVDYSGYNLELFLGDFNNDGRDEIMLRGAYGGTGGFAISVVYVYSNGKLKQIFNPDMFSEKYELTSKYLEDYMVEVLSNTLREKYTFYIGNKPKIYLDIIYDKNGKVKKDEIPTVSAINNAFPIKAVYQETYYLFIRQRVVGVSNADTIGFIESFVSLIDDKITIFNIGSFEFGEKITKDNSKKEIDNTVEFIDDGFEGGNRSFINKSEEKKFKNDNIYFTDNLKDKFESGKELGAREFKTIKTTNTAFVDFYNSKEEIKDVSNRLNACYKTNEIRIEEEVIKNRNESNNTLIYNIKEDVSREIANKFPIDTVFINVKTDLGDKSFIKEDIDNDGHLEILVPYLLNDSPYIGVIQENRDFCTLKANFRGEGCTIEELIVKKIDREYYVFVGFKVNEDLNKLYILRLRGGRLSKAFDNNEYFYNKMYLKDLNDDCNYELILWKKNNDGGYQISIYNIKESGLHSTNKYDKKYYKEVVDYYKGKIKSYEDTSIYPYYLALAYEKREEYKKALAVVEKALESKTPYPSKNELEKFKKRLKKAIR
ncbi:hypothetical protein [Clostridium sp. B9]|uniref:hypothetical protein n=1 Tax=Clostridium sp. B9 TaxID=3423224 RepID=UPI003D2ED510